MSASDCFLKSVESCFGSSDLYTALGVEKNSKATEIKRAYHRLSLKVHPDRVKPTDVTEATRKFQVLGKIYSVLSDKNKRALYDRYGTVEENDSIFSEDKDWIEYWRLLFRKVTLKDIKKFEESYKGSDEERETLKSVYLEKEGDMDAILQEVVVLKNKQLAVIKLRARTVLCATVDDEPRFRKQIELWIAKHEVPSFPAFMGETQAKRRLRKRKHEQEAKEAEKALKNLGHGANSSLNSLIKSNQKSREEQMDTFLQSLAEKYGGKNAKHPKTDPFAEKDQTEDTGSGSKRILGEKGQLRVSAEGGRGVLTTSRKRRTSSELSQTLSSTTETTDEGYFAYTSGRGQRKRGRLEEEWASKRRKKGGHVSEEESDYTNSDEMKGSYEGEEEEEEDDEDYEEGTGGDEGGTLNSKKQQGALNSEKQQDALNSEEGDDATSVASNASESCTSGEEEEEDTVAAGKRKSLRVRNQTRAGSKQRAPRKFTQTSTRSKGKGGSHATPTRKGKLTMRKCNTSSKARRK